MQSITIEAELTQMIEQLIRIEPRFIHIVETHGPPPTRLVPQGLESLLRIVTDQLISLKSGAAIWKRVEGRLSPFDPDFIISHSVEELRTLGLTAAKARTFLAAAQAARQGMFEPARMATLTDTALISTLTTIPGIGPWTAEIYALSALGRVDCWPTGDLALQVAAQDFLKLEDRPDAQAMVEIGVPWRPYRSVAARLLWSHYRGLKGIGQAII
jgi:DNA-3-methyladenine glycosylase II